MSTPRQDELARLTERLALRGIDARGVMNRLKGQTVELPSWAFACAGTRFGPVIHPGAAVTIEEKLADAAQVHRVTGIAPSVAVHVLWDFPNGLADCSVVKECAQNLGMRIGAINPNVFQHQNFVHGGSICNADHEIRWQAIEHMRESVAIGQELGSSLLSLWFADGTNYPGEGNFRVRFRNAIESLREVYDVMPTDMGMLIEYKPFEPGFYHTDIPDWGTAYAMCQRLGDRANVLVDLGHHLPGHNIEHTVGTLIELERLGGFHFNDHRYADDDLTVGSCNPYQLFLVFHELVKAEGRPNANPPIAYMVDQADQTKPRIPALVQTVTRLQSMLAKALCVDLRELEKMQAIHDVIGAEEILCSAFNTDVEPLLIAVREEMGLAPDPLRAFMESGYLSKIVAERGMRQGAGLGT